MRTVPAHTFSLVVAAGIVALWAPATSSQEQNKTTAPAVAVAEDSSSFTLSNGIVTARVSKRSGDLTSLQYMGLETLTDKSGHAGGYWSHDTTGGKETITRVTIDPRTNSGERGEVSVKGISGGLKMGHGPGAAAGGDFPADIEIRYCLGRGDSGVYTYCTFEHQPGYPAATMTEARYCAKLADLFDWMTLDAKRNQHFPADLREGDKYIYTAVQFEHPVYGWSSTTKNIGFWLINPSAEYLSGGPTKVEFLCHRDTTQVAAPCVLNYWRSSHYGGAVVSVAEGEPWSKVVGPFFLYVNSGGDPQALWKNAQGQSAREIAKWPYDWVAGVDYPRRGERATVSGQLVLTDPQMPHAKTANLLVGLTHPAYAAPVTRPGFGPPRPIDWQTDAKHYEFWVRGDEQGNFAIPNVRAGTYTLHAIADGVLGEFSQADITVAPGQSLNLGKLSWAPLRRGRQLWEIGIPNRNGAEFFHGEDYADPAISLQYATLFPQDVNYVIGQSDFRKDWFFQHLPHNEDPNARVVPFGGVRGSGRATPFAVTFDLPRAPGGKATLRLAICGTSARSIDVTVNDQPAGQVERLLNDGAIPRHSIQGLWYEREVAFDAALMKQGTNVLKLIVPAGPINNGIIYDYVRLELDEPHPASAKSVPGQADAAATALPGIFIAGDSTAANGIPGAVGWGKHLGAHFDPVKAKVINHARGGRSSRTFVTEGHWDRLLAELKAGDIVLIQFGHNDGAAINSERLARGSLPGLGDESEVIDNLVTKRHEVVRTFGWYVRKMIADVKEKGARPILLSLTARNIWKDGRVERGSGRYGQWTRELAKAESVPFVDLTKLVADRYEQMGQDAVKELFPRDHTHTSEDGAKLNATLVVAGLKGLRDESLVRLLSAAGRLVPTADPSTVAVARQARRGGDPADFSRWLNLPEPGDPALPSLFLIGDSTVRNGRGDGIDGQFGWGDPLAAAFDPAKLNVVNRAIGGTGARSFITQGHWDRVRALLKPGDFVILQFGHNDNGPRGPLLGIGDETEERQNSLTNQSETVHTFGWYLRKYIADAKAHGATPIVCSLVPRNIWRDGKIARPQGSHADWARAVAQTEQAAFLDLHELIAARYDAVGEPAVGKLFADVRVHTNWDGAVLSAESVVAGLKNLPRHPLAAYFLAADTASLAASVQPFVTRQELAGAVMLVANREKVLALETVGWADVAANKPMRADSIFWIASQSKPITAAALMMLADEGKVSLDDPVEKYLPEFRGQMFVVEKDDDHKVLRRPRHSLTVRNILSHTSGLPFKSALEVPTLDLWPLSVRVRSYAMTQLDFDPDTKYQYSNAGINTAARIIEVVTGTTFERFLDERLFQPLGMTDTTFWPTDEQAARIAKSYQAGPEKKGLEETTIGQLHYPLTDRSQRFPMPAGGLFSTAGDVARFYQMLLNGGQLRGRRCLSENAVKELTTRQTPRELENSYGLGFAVGNATFGHGGAYSTNTTAHTEPGLILVWLVQHAGFPGEGGKSQEAFRQAALQAFAPDSK
jgi:rhamnogalacturonan endolyase